MQVDIEGQATDSLRSLGICSGDTLWLMSAPQGAQQSSNSHLAESAAEPTLSTQAAMPSTATLDKAAPADSAQPSPSAATDPPSDVHMVCPHDVLAHDQHQMYDQTPSLYTHKGSLETLKSFFACSRHLWNGLCDIRQKMLLKT